MASSGTIAKINAGGNDYLVASTAYGTCDTAADTADKVATIQDSAAFTLVTGVTVHIKMTNSNTASSPTLDVNSTGAKNIYRYGTTVPGTSAATSWYAGAVVSFTYDGSYWQMNDHIPDTNTQAVSSVTIGASSPISSSTSTAQTGAVSTTISHGNSGVTAGTYGSATAVPVIAVNATGHITSASTATVSASTKYTTCNLPKFTAAGSQSVTVSGVTANSHPVLDVYISSAGNVASCTEAWSHIYRADSAANSITFYSDAATSTALTVMVKDY